MAVIESARSEQSILREAVRNLKIEKIRKGWKYIQIRRRFRKSLSRKLMG